MAWNVDRLGRSLKTLVAFLSELHALGIDLFLHQQGLDTTTPAGKASSSTGLSPLNRNIEDNSLIIVSIASFDRTTDRTKRIPDGH
jgi:DNA invertase Pin-like site-specific DNA recombinase